LAEEAGVGTVISGAVYLEGDSLEITVDVTDVAEGRLLGTVGPVVGARAATREAIAEVQQRVMGLLAMRADEFRSHWEEADWAKESGNPPTFEAWQAMQEAPSQLDRQSLLDAVEHYRRAAELDTTWADPLIMLALRLMALGQPQEADSVLSLLEARGDQLTPYERASVQTRRARLVGDRDLWYRSVRRAAELGPGKGEVFNSALVAFKLKNRPAEAIQILASVDPDHRMARESQGYWNVLIAAHRALGEHREALVAAKRALTLIPAGEDWFLYLQARELAATGGVEELFEVLDELETVAAAAAEPSVWVYRARVEAVETLRAHGHHAAAEDVLDRTIDWLESRSSLEAAHGWDRLYYGRALVNAGRYEDAIVLFDGLIEEFPNAWLPRGLRGYVAAVRGDTAQALLDEQWFDQYDWPAGRMHAHPDYWCLAILGALGDNEGVAELLADAPNWWDFEEMSPDAVELDAVRDHPAFQELIRPKG
jgi:tetratricopeptide (TPR) repeat protein